MSDSFFQTVFEALLHEILCGVRIPGERERIPEHGIAVPIKQRGEHRVIAAAATDQLCVVHEHLLTQEGVRIQECDISDRP